FFPKTEKYVSLFKKGDTTKTADKRNNLRIEIKENIAAAVASGKDFEGFSIRLWLLKCYVTRECRLPYAIATVLYSDVLMTLAALTWH
nr:rRNA-processing protein EFG1-like [Tanacetum cinerariifolium]